MNFIGSEFATPKGGVLKVVGLIKKDKTTRKLYTTVCSICSLDSEMFPEPFKSDKANLLKGSVSCGCSNNPRLDERQVSLKINRICNKSSLKFVGFVNGYKNASSKIIIECPTHGIWTPTYSDFANHGTSCPSCGKESHKKKMRVKDPIKRIKEICDKEGLVYHGYEDGYKTQHTKFSVECPTHGIWTPTYSDFVNHSTRCPGCMESGYNPSKSGNFYIYKYQLLGVGEVYKFGITNREPSVRSREHTQGIDKNYLTAELVCLLHYEDGRIPPFIEKYIKKNNNTGVCYWLTSGNTETLCVKTTDINKLVEQVRGHSPPIIIDK